MFRIGTQSLGNFKIKLSTPNGFCILTRYAFSFNEEVIPNGIKLIPKTPSFYELGVFILAHVAMPELWDIVCRCAVVSPDQAQCIMFSKIRTEKTESLRWTQEYEKTILPPNFKTIIVPILLSEDKTLSEASAEYGVHVNQLRRLR